MNYILLNMKPNDKKKGHKKGHQCLWKAITLQQSHHYVKNSYKQTVSKTLDGNYKPGSMTPSGIEIKKTKENANVMEDNISKRKHNHSIAPAILNLGREFASASFIFMSLNLDSSSKLLVVVAPEIVSVKCCITGALHTPTNLDSSRAEGM